MTQYIDQITLNEKIPTDNFPDLLRALPDLYGTRTLFRYRGADGQVVDVGAWEFQQMCAALGASFRRMGLTEGKVAVVGETSVSWIATYIAQVAAGGVIVPVDKDLPDDEIAHIIADSGASAVVYAPTLAEALDEVRKGAPDVRHYIAMDPAQGCQDASLMDLVERGRDGVAETLATVVDPNQMSTLLYTSGTTGRAKGVMLSHRNIFSAATGALQIIRVGNKCLSTLPIHHTYEFTHGIIMMMLARVTIALSESPRYFMRNLELFRPDTMCVVPLYVEMMYKKIWATFRQQGREKDLEDLLETSRRLLAEGEDRRAELFAPVRELLGGDLTLILSGGAPLTAFYANAFWEFGIPLVQGYGITECGPVVAANPNDRNKAGSIGVPIPCCEVRLSGMNESGQGELSVKGDNVMLGYYKNPEATAAAMHDGWFDTGDLATMDNEGYIFITGRAKNLIVLANGKNVQPEEIEGYLSESPLVTEAVVYAPADETGVQRELHAQIYANDTAREDRSDEQMRELLEQAIADINRRLPGYKQISRFILRSRPFDKTTKMSIQRFKIDTTL